MRRLTAFLLLTLLATVSVSAQETEAENEAPAPVLAIESITLDPAKPAIDTLVRLTVTIANRGEEPVTGLGFDVTVNGVSLPVYDNQLFVEAVEPGASTEVKLYNFWTTETGRPAPQDGKLTVEVALREAALLDRSKTDDGTPLWTFGAPVPALPVSQSVTVPLTGQ